MKGKDRWHALFVLHDDATPALDLLHEYRTRQHHEQGHRIGVHDLWIDTSPSGYPKRGRPDRPGFRQGPLTLYAWIAALAWDALRALGHALPARFHLAHPRTLRRWVLRRDADLILSPSHTCSSCWPSASAEPGSAPWSKGSTRPKSSCRGAAGAAS
jgi:hypothetical protein